MPCAVAAPEEDSTDDVNIGSSYGRKPVRREGEFDQRTNYAGRAYVLCR